MRRAIPLVSFSFGSPGLTLEIDFAIVDEFPYSCIVGMNLLNTLKNRSADNNSNTFYLHSSNLVRTEK